MVKQKPPCEHPTTTLSQNWDWVVCADKDCGVTIKPNMSGPSARVANSMGKVWPLGWN